MSFEAAVISGGGDETTLAKYLVMAVKGPAQQWYSSLKAKSIHSWDQLKTNLLVDFQGFQPAGLTDIDLFNCKQQLKERLSQYFKKIIQIKAQIPNIPDEVVIITAIKGLRVGQCASHLAREKTKYTACSFRRKRSRIIYYWLVWSEREILFQIIIHDCIQASEQVDGWRHGADRAVTDKMNHLHPTILERQRAQLQGRLRSIPTQQIEVLGVVSGKAFDGITSS